MSWADPRCNAILGRPVGEVEQATNLLPGLKNWVNLDDYQW